MDRPKATPSRGDSSAATAREARLAAALRANLRRRKAQARARAANERPTTGAVGDGDEAASREHRPAADQPG